MLKQLATLKDKILEREDKTIWSATHSPVRQFSDWPNGEDGFLLITFLDQQQIDDGFPIDSFAKLALENGARSIMCAGTAGSSVEDIFDGWIVSEKIFGLDRFEPEPDDCIHTTAHHREPLDEVIWDAFFASCSCERFDACRNTILVVFEDGDPRINELEEMCSSLESRLDVVLARDDRWGD